MALRSYSDGALFAEAFGEGPPRVLALHGWGRRGADFKASLGGVSALALDLPGFGASPPPSEVLGADGYADIVADVLDEFDEPPVLVGHSFGGRIAVCLAAKAPHRVGPLVLTGVPLLRLSSKRKPAVGYRVIRSLNEVGVVSDARLEAERQKRGSADYRAATGVMRDILVKVVNEEYQDQMKAIASPTYLLWGEQDSEVPVAVARQAESMIIGAGGIATLEVLGGVGHHVPLQAPADLCRITEAALR